MPRIGDIIHAFFALLIVVLLGYASYLVYLQLSEPLAVLFILAMFLVMAAVVLLVLTFVTAKLGVLITLSIGLLGIAVAIILSSWNMTDKEIALIALTLLGYIAYNELTKPPSNQTRQEKELREPRLSVPSTSTLSA